MIGWSGNFSAKRDESKIHPSSRLESTGGFGNAGFFLPFCLLSSQDSCTITMADLATPSAATMSTIDAGAQKPAFTKPEKPDQAEYEKTLAEAQKALDAAVERQASATLEYLVSAYVLIPTYRSRSRPSSTRAPTTRSLPRPRDSRSCAQDLTRSARHKSPASRVAPSNSARSSVSMNSSSHASTSKRLPAAVSLSAPSMKFRTRSTVCKPRSRPAP